MFSTKKSEFRSDLNRWPTNVGEEGVKFSLIWLILIIFTITAVGVNNINF